MRVLVACEFSGTVRRAFADRGHEVWSCDLLPAEDHSANHYQRDVLGISDDGLIAAGVTMPESPDRHVTVKRMEGRKIRPDRWCRTCGFWCGMNGNCTCCREAKRSDDSDDWPIGQVTA